MAKLINKVDISEVLETNYMPYTMSVIVSRALPEIDGLKPSHRKLLYTMYKMGLLKGNKTKSANIVGATMRLSPHGDMAIYGTMVRLTEGNESLLVPYIDSKGNFGKVYSRDMAFAAPRYTEAKLSKVSQEFFKDINKNVVDFVPNYDNTTEEPTLLPVTFPNILVNPNTGIAVGMASNICSFNLGEICNATIKRIRGDKDYLKEIKAPDFPTGGEIIYNKELFQKIYETGKGTFYIRGKYKYDKKNNRVEIYEIPYTTTVEAIIDSIIDLVKKGDVKELTDIRDGTDKDGLKIILDLKRNTDVEQLMLKLFKLTPLESNFSCNFNILIEGTPKVMGIGEILDEWIKFRVECIERQLRYDIDKEEHKLHLLKGLEKVLLDLDKAVEIVKNTEKDKDVIENLMEYFEIDEVQANYVAEIKLRNFNKEFILNKTKDIGKTEKEIKRLGNILKSEKRIKNIIVKDLENVIKNYDKPRKTTIIDEKKVIVPDEEILIEDYNVRMYLTKEGYLKKVPLVSLRGNTKQKLKDTDYVMQEIDTTNKSDVLLFSNKHTVYKLRIYELEDTKTSSFGEYIPNLLELDGDEEILYMVCTEDYTGSMLFFFENGKGARIDLKSYETKTNRRQLLNAYSDSSKLVRMMYLEEDTEVVLHSDIDKILVVDTSQIGIKTHRSSAGVILMRHKKDKKTKVQSKVINVKDLEDVSFKDKDYYKSNIPAVGKYLKKEDKIHK